ncbi:hypothetical protein AB0C15_32205 [Micromonospora sp. NPDC048835]|uniref:hypothetical protein n=1 Tax=Micromonospora sp. NPDC048835 TaxID=3155147 RepID=UPI0033F3999D
MTAGIGIGGTLLAASITQILSRRNEQQRQSHEDQQRWLQDRFRVCREVVATAVKAERQLYSVASFMPDDDKPYQDMRAAGYSSVLIAFDMSESLLRAPGDEEVVREMLAEVIESLEGLDLLQAELALLEEGELVREAEELIGALWDVVGSMEILGPASDTFAAYDHCHRRRLEFQASARTKLGVVAPVRSKRTARFSPSRRNGIAKSVTGIHVPGPGGRPRPVSSDPGPWEHDGK